MWDIHNFQRRKMKTQQFFEEVLHLNKKSLKGGKRNK